jgi:hypothetical protein
MAYSNGALNAEMRFELPDGQFADYAAPSPAGLAAGASASSASAVT